MRAQGLIAIVAAGASVLAGCGAAQHPSRGPSTPPAAVAHFKIDDSPQQLVAASGRLWVGDLDDGKVYEIDPSSGRVIAKHTVDGAADSISWLASSGSRVWVGASGDHGDIVRTVDTRTGELGPARTVGSNGDSAVATSSAIYVSDSANGEITRVGADGGRPLTYHVPGGGLSAAANLEITAIVATPAAVWVAIRDPVGHTTTLVRYDPSTLAKRESVDLSDVYVTSLLVSHHSVWAATASGPVLRVTNGEVRTSVDFPKVTTSLVADSQGVWVLEIVDGTVDHISSASGKVDATIPVAGRYRGNDTLPTGRALAALPGELWMTDRQTGFAYRITLPSLH